MRKLLTGTLVALCFPVFLYAQNENTQKQESELDQLYRNEVLKNSNLHERVLFLEKDSVSKVKELDKLRGDTARLKKAISTLNDEVGSWKEKAKAKIDKSQITHLQNEVNGLLEQFEKMKLRHSNDSLKIVRLRADSVMNKTSIAELSIFRKEFVKSKITIYNSYLEKLFSEITLDSLQSMKAYLAEFKGDAEIDAFVKKIDQCGILKKDITGYQQVLLNRFDRDAINKSRKEIIAAKSKMNEAQWNELYDTTDAYLSRYYYGMQLFQSIIKSINKDLAIYRKDGGTNMKPTCIRITEEIFNKNEEKINKLIMHIPYLSERFVKYRSQMLDDPTVRMEELEVEIISINIDK